MKRLRWIVLLIVTLLLLSQFFFVKGAAAEKFAAMRGDQLVLVEPNVKESVIALPAHRSVANLQWSPNGQWLGLVLVDENYALRLWLVDVTGAQPQLRDLSAQTGVLESGFPIAFTPEGNVLYASPVSDQVSANGEYWV
ncbi:MAG: hypothetical protein KF726_24755, partial [Anaerolineae bacterium]|nr:hypothetical protein [Anaerolineae bacterium]